MVDLVQNIAFEPVATEPEVVSWMVLFLEGAPRRQHFFQIFTSRAWRHCLCYGWANGRWIVYDAGDRRSQVKVLTDDQFAAWDAAITPRVTAAVKIDTGERALPVARLGLWCVSVVKHLTAIRSGAFTPKALFRDLLANGGKVSAHYGQGQNAKNPGKS